MLFIEPLSTYLIENPDFTEQDEQDEVKRLFARQQLIDAVARGEASAEDLLDMIESHGIEPAAYVDSVVHNVEFVIKNGISICEP